MSLDDFMRGKLGTGTIRSNYTRKLLTNEDDVKTAVTGVYAEFRGISEWGRYKTSWGSVMTLQEVPTDLWAANWFYKAHTDFMWKATDYFVCEIFEFFVPAITKATALIARIQDAPVSDDIKIDTLPN